MYQNLRTARCFIVMIITAKCVPMIEGGYRLIRETWFVQQVQSMSDMLYRISVSILKHAEECARK